MKALRSLALVALVALPASLAVVACDDSSDGVHETVPAKDSGIDPGTDSGVTILPDGAIADTGAPVDDCVKNPKTHLEIINACTTAQKIDKHPVLPLLLPDGGRPPVP